MGYAQLVIGPAGGGKLPYFSSLYQHCETMRRNVHLVNLDPAVERFDYPVAMGGPEASSSPNSNFMGAVRGISDGCKNREEMAVANMVERDDVVVDSLEVAVHD